MKDFTRYWLDKCRAVQDSIVMDIPEDFFRHILTCNVNLDQFEKIKISVERWDEENTFGVRGYRPNGRAEFSASPFNADGLEKEWEMFMKDLNWLRRKDNK